MENKSKIISEFQINKKDVGSMQVQIALLTEQINRLNENSKKNKKDYVCKNILLKKIHRRNKFLRIIKEKDFDNYSSIIKRLGLRK